MIQWSCDVGTLGSLNHLIIWHFSEERSVADVLCNTGIKQYWLLGDNADLWVHPSEVEVSQVHTIQHQLSTKRIVEPLNEGDNGTLSTATGSDKGKSLPRLHWNTQPLQYWSLWPRGVVELHTVHCNRTRGLLLRIRSEMTMTHARGEGEGRGLLYQHMWQDLWTGNILHFEMRMLQDVYFCNCLCNQIILGWIVIIEELLVQQQCRNEVLGSHSQKVHYRSEFTVWQILGENGATTKAHIPGSEGASDV